MVHRIFALYHHPLAQIRENEIQNGTRQGCSLSTLLYVLVMEHLMQAIRSNPDIQEVVIKGGHIKCSAFADDLHLYISNCNCGSNGVWPPQ